MYFLCDSIQFRRIKKWYSSYSIGFIHSNPFSFAGQALFCNKIEKKTNKKAITKSKIILLNATRNAVQWVIDVSQAFKQGRIIS